VSEFCDCFLPQLFDQYWNTPAPYGILTSQMDNLICWNHSKSVHWRSFSMTMTIMSLILSGMDTLHSRREHLIQRFY